MPSRTSASSSITTMSLSCAGLAIASNVRAARPAPDRPTRAARTRRSASPCRAATSDRSDGRAAGTGRRRSTDPGPARRADPAPARPPGRTPRRCCGCWSSARPMPLSHTSMRTLSPRRRQPTMMPPRDVYRMAFDTRLSRIRSSRMASVRTQVLLGTTRRLRPFSRAAAANVVSMRPSRWPTGNSAMSGASTPASSLEMSSRALNSSFMDSMAASIRATSRARSAGSVWSPSCAANRFKACSGWRRSWLAAARKRDLARLARSTSRLRSPSSRLRPARAMRSLRDSTKAFWM